MGCYKLECKVIRTTHPTVGVKLIGANVILILMNQKVKMSATFREVCKGTVLKKPYVGL